MIVGRDLTMPRKTQLVRTEPGFSTGSNAPTEPRTLERSLGARIRSMRREHDLSVLDLASASNISAGMLSKIENGQISPSLSTLQALASALTVSLSMLFAATEERRDCSFRKQVFESKRRITRVTNLAAFEKNLHKIFTFPSLTATFPSASSHYGGK